MNESNRLIETQHVTESWSQRYVDEQHKGLLPSKSFRRRPALFSENDKLSASSPAFYRRCPKKHRDLRIPHVHPASKHTALESTQRLKAHTINDAGETPEIVVRCPSSACLITFVALTDRVQSKSGLQQWPHQHLRGLHR